MPQYQSIVSIIGGAIALVACLLFIASNALPTWGISSNHPLNSTIGLWQYCTKHYNETQCISLGCSSFKMNSAQCRNMNVARAFITTVCILSALSAVCLFASFFEFGSSNKICFTTGCDLLTMGFVCGLMGTIFGQKLFLYYKYSIGVAGILSIVGTIISFVGTLLTIIISIKISRT